MTSHTFWKDNIKINPKEIGEVDSAITGGVPDAGLYYSENGSKTGKPD
jgi:hypothetical protein